MCQLWHGPANKTQSSSLLLVYGCFEYEVRPCKVSIVIQCLIALLVDHLQYVAFCWPLYMEHVNTRCYLDLPLNVICQLLMKPTSTAKHICSEIHSGIF